MLTLMHDCFSPRAMFASLPWAFVPVTPYVLLMVLPGADTSRLKSFTLAADEFAASTRFEVVV